MAGVRQVVAMGRSGAAAVALAAGLLLLARAANADPGSVRIVRATDLAALPLIVAEHDHLVEKQALARGLGAISVQWLVPGSGVPLEQLVNGQADLVAVLDLADFVAAWDERSGTPQEIRALTALSQMPYLLLSRNPSIATIRDFAAKDRIAVPAPRTSLPAVMLEMAAAQEWGVTHYDRLDALTVARGDEAGDDALQSGKGEIDTHFVRLPYADDERANSAIHRVMDSFDVAGPHSVAVLVATSQFRDANPALCASIAAAVSEADDFIARSRGAAAELYDTVDKDQDIPVEVLTDMLGDPDLTYKAAPAGLLHLTAFLHQIGRLKHNPDTWQQLFFPEVYKLTGG
jgi:NitT/TauT family transport system substrate-binding protein